MKTYPMTDKAFECVCGKGFDKQTDLHAHIEAGCKKYDRWVRTK